MKLFKKLRSESIQSSVKSLQRSSNLILLAQDRFISVKSSVNSACKRRSRSLKPLILQRYTS